MRFASLLIAIAMTFNASLVNAQAEDQGGPLIDYGTRFLPAIASKGMICVTRSCKRCVNRWSKRSAKNNCCFRVSNLCTKTANTTVPFCIRINNSQWRTRHV